MPNVESQLRQYFDSTVERIDAEDVLAGVRVTNQSQRWNARARRPLRAAVASAALVTVAISAVVAGAWMLGQTGSRIVGPGPTPTATQPVAPGVWPIALIAGGSALAVTATLVGRKRRPFAAILTTRRRKGDSMETLERETPEVRIEHLTKSNRGLIIALVVALLVVAGLGGWMLFDTIDTGVSGEINALLDEYLGYADTSDWEASAEMFTVTGVFVDDDGDIVTMSDYVAYYEGVEESFGKFAVESLGDRTIIEDPDRNRFYVAAPMQIGVGASPYFKGFSTFVLTELADVSLKIISHQFTPHESHR